MPKHLQMKKQEFLTNAGKQDKTLNDYFDMPKQVMRNGKLINIEENNKRVFRKK